MTDIQKKLFELQDVKYGDFQHKLTPVIERDSIIGVRSPMIKKLAKELIADDNTEEFLAQLPHKYYDENMLHSAILTKAKNFDTCLMQVERFLPYVDNWAVCDTLSPKVLMKNKELFVQKIVEWVASDKPYTCRFGIEMLMNYFLDAEFEKSILEYPATVKSEEYYVNMMIAWFYATALAKHWDETVVYLTENKLPTWVHNKTIQKARESYRITDEQKEFLKSLKR